MHLTAARLVTLIATLLGIAAAPAGLSAAAPAGVQGLLDIGGMQRTYVVHVPPGAANGLVINLHGAGLTGRDQAAATNYDAIADRYGFVVAYPDGIDLSWADGRGASVPDRQGVDDVGFLSTLITELTRQYAISPGRVFVTGMSAGGFMAQRLACDRADLVAAVMPVAGTLGAAVPCAPSRPVSVLEVHGDADPVVPFTGGPMVGRGGPSDILSAPAMADRWRAINGCPPPVTTPGRSVSTGCADGTEVDFVTIPGGGHVWPMSWPFDASQASADFFAAHGR
ncbi:alpha/beta hydrolase family esterase [Mycolicibacterium psychrotolerans]|uniref:Esterase n=1 Tax=Mycolicibacterium psychrotolerans TaxID=216929 RepID=A0A7I7M8Q6_9MYCO|nr:esterase [Mycolicibacterium psychrotolerans]